MTIKFDWYALIDEAIKRRKEQKLTQEQASTICGISKPTYVSFEKGELNITLKNALQILFILGFTTGKLRDKLTPDRVEIEPSINH